MKHTPGPWEAVKTRYGHFIKAPGLDLAVTRSTLIGVAGEVDCEPGNANLMAAGPVLLELARSIAIAPCNGDDCESNEGGLCDSCAARAVLKRTKLEAV